MTQVTKFPPGIGSSATDAEQLRVNAFQIDYPSERKRSNLGQNQPQIGHTINVFEVMTFSAAGR